MGLSLTTAPTVEPVTLAQAKAQCNVSGNDDNEDAYIESLIAPVRLAHENFVGRQMCTATYTLTADAFAGGVIRLPRAPLASVTSITYVDTAGDTQTWSDDEYDVDTSSDLVPGRIATAYGYTWPITRSQMNAVTIVFVAGYGGTADVPADDVHAMKFLIAHWFNIREPVVTGTITAELPLTYKSLMWHKRLLW